MSYEVITPSAARAIFEAIYWKPQIKWQILSIELLNPIAFCHVKRAETASMANIYKSEILAEKVRQMRSSLLLRDVKYRVTAQLHPLDGGLAKHRAIFLRRARSGQCFAQPYLGCREFAADWRLVEQSAEERQPPIDLTRDLGEMLHDIDFSDPERAQPQFFRALMVNGVIKV